MRNRRTVPKPIRIFFFLLAFVYGIDLGFTKSLRKSLSGVAKVISLLVSISTAFVLSWPLYVKNEDSYWLTINFITFLLNFIITACSKYNVYEFLIEIHKTDNTSTKKVSISVILWLYVLTLYISKWVLTYIGCELMFPELCNYGLMPYYVYCIPALAIDWIYGVIILIYCYIYYCLKDITTLFEKDGNIDILKKRYLAVAKSYDKIRPLYEKLVIVAVLLDLPKMMGLLYNMLKYYIKEVDIVASMGEYMYAFHIISNISSSGAMVQMVVWKVDALVYNLLDIILQEKDARRCEELTRVVKYVKARLLWHPLVGVVQVDMQLPSFIFSVCSTYLIVLIQFTHLID